ncbi:MAG: NADH-quinone oxidoreductase subunit NuoK [Candidatus Methylacidiphilales bacterium]|nr:NADH-quinone oxidoreductase subunit NuoK [Candidatus Methylacidiphilales bacterium]
MPLQHILILSSILFFMGLLGVLTRRNAIMTLASLEIMINAACLNFVAFWRYRPYTDNSQGLLFALFAIAVAAAEAAVGLALVIALYRHYKTVDVEKFRNESPLNGAAARNLPASDSKASKPTSGA